tara:strand:+ start:118 stop:339 length:222 start_codon:yes stop_codon:yes gene_type:complete
MFPKKYSNLLFILVMGFGMSLLMTLIITYVNTGMDNGYLIRFLKAWAVGLPIAITTALLVGPITKKFVDKITK